jgi:hypothetical protein
MLLSKGEEKGKEYYRFFTDGGDSCERCLQIDRLIFKICEANYGENLPPLHPNCRCEIEIIDDTPIDTEIDVPLENNENTRTPSRLSNINPDVFWHQKGGWSGFPNNGFDQCARTAIATMVSINTSSIITPNDVASRCTAVTINGETEKVSEDIYGSDYDYEDFITNGTRHGFNRYAFSNESELLFAINYELNQGRAVVVMTNGSGMHWVTVTGTVDGKSATSFEDLMGIDPWFNASNQNNENGGNNNTSQEDENRSGIVKLYKALDTQTAFHGNLRIFTFNFD